MPNKELIQLCPSEAEVLETSEQNQGAIPFPSNEPLLGKIYFSLAVGEDIYNNSIFFSALVYNHVEIKKFQESCQYLS